MIKVIKCPLTRDERKAITQEGRDALQSGGRLVECPYTPWSWATIYWTRGFNQPDLNSISIFGPEGTRRDKTGIAVYYRCERETAGNPKQETWQ